MSMADSEHQSLTRHTTGRGEHSENGSLVRHHSKTGRSRHKSKARSIHFRTPLEKRAGDFALLGVQALVFFVLCALPMILGGRSVLSFGLAGVILLCALVLWTLSLILRGKVEFQSCSGLILFALIFLVGGLQLSPSFSTFSTPLLQENLATNLWTETADFLGTSLPAIAALAPAVHMEKLLFVGLGCILYILLCQCFNTEKSLFILACVTFAITTAYAFLGIARFVSHDPYFLWIYLGKNASVAGPFVSRNNFAFMQELGVLLGMGLIMSMAHGCKTSVSYKFFGKTKPYVIIFVAFCLIISLLSLLLSASRGGILGVLIGLSLFIIYAVSRRMRSRSTLVLIFILGATTLLFSSYGMDRLLTRFDSITTGQDASALMRLETWKVALELLSLSPYLGFGFGAFRYLGPMYDMAWHGDTVAFNVHNDFIELPLSLGLPCAVLILVILAYFFARTLYRILIYRSPQSEHGEKTALDLSAWAYLGIGCLCGLVAIACHEFVDYGLQQPANLALTTAVAVMAGHVARLLHEHSHGAPSGWKLGRPLYVLPLLCGVIAFVISTPYVQSIAAGIPLEKIRYLKYNPEVKRSMSPLATQDALKRQSKIALMLAPEATTPPDLATLFANPERPDALEEYAKSEYHMARLKLEDIYGKKISDQLGRNVSGDRVWLAQYAPMRQELATTLTDTERLTISNHYAQSVLAYQRLLRLAPTDGVALAGLALAVYGGAPWSENPSLERAKAYDTISKAAAMYANVESVHSLAIYLYERALRDKSLFVDDASGDCRRAMGTQYLRSAEVVLRTDIRKLDTILPIAWDISQDLETVEKLVPQTIAGNEQLYRFWRKISYWYGAERALLRMQKLNASRLDVESPETMGNIAFLRREKRSKGLIELRIAEYFIPIYENLQDESAITANKERIRILRHAENAKRIAEIDVLMQRNEYILAEQKLKKLPNDVSALLRYAYIAHVGGRTELFRRLMTQMEPDQDLFNTKEREDYQYLCSFL